MADGGAEDGALGFWAAKNLSEIGAGRLAGEAVDIVTELRAQGLLERLDHAVGGGSSGEDSDDDDDYDAAGGGGRGSKKRFTLREMMRQAENESRGRETDPYLAMMGVGGEDEEEEEEEEEDGSDSNSNSLGSEEEEEEDSEEEANRRGRPPQQLIPMLRRLLTKRPVKLALRSNCIPEQVPTHIEAFGKLAGHGEVGQLLSESRQTMVDNKSVDLFKMALAKQLEVRKMGGQGKRASLGPLAVASKRNTDIYGAACLGVLKIRRLKPTEQRLVDRDWMSLDKKLVEDFSRRRRLHGGGESDDFEDDFEDDDAVDDLWSNARGNGEETEVKARTIKGYELLQSGNFKWQAQLGITRPTTQTFQRIVCRVCQKWVKKPTHIATFYDGFDDASDDDSGSSDDGLNTSSRSRRSKAKGQSLATYPFARARKKPSQLQSQSQSQSPSHMAAHPPGRICCCECGRSLAKGTELVNLLRAWGAFPLSSIATANMINEEQRNDLTALTTAIALHLYDDATEPAYLQEDRTDWTDGRSREGRMSDERRVGSMGGGGGGSGGGRQLKLKVAGREDDEEEEFDDDDFQSTHSSLEQQPSQSQHSNSFSRNEGDESDGSGSEDNVPLAQRWTGAEPSPGGRAFASNARGRSRSSNAASEVAVLDKRARSQTTGEAATSNWPTAGLGAKRRKGLIGRLAPSARLKAARRAPLSLATAHENDDDDVVDLT